MQTYSPSAPSVIEPAPVPAAAAPTQPTAVQAAPSATQPASAAADRLHYLFRRTDAQGTSHVLKRALFIYRGVPLP
jgi:hypothetical protein